MTGVFKKTLEFITPYRSYAWMNIVFNIFYALFNVLSIIVFIPTLGILFGTQENVPEKPVFEGMGNIRPYVEDSLNYFLTQKMDVEGPVSALVFICIVSAAIFFLKNVFRYLALYVLVYIRTGIVKDIQDELYLKTISLPLAYFSEKRKGDLLTRMTTDVKEVELSFLNSLEALVREPITILFVLIAMFSISTKLTLFVFVFLPFSGFIISFVGKKLKSQSLLAQRENGIFLSLIEETLTGLRIIKGFNAERNAEAKFKRSTNRFKHIMTKVIHRKRLASPLSEFLGVIVVITVLWYGGSLVLTDNSTLTPQEFMGYIGLFYTIINPVKEITTVNYNIRKGSASAERIFEVLATENPITDAPDAIEKLSLDQAITLNNISFKYEDDYVLRNFSLSIPKGKTVALVGQSGSGKSTIANLLTRFYDVHEGSIEIDGINIKNISKNALRELMGIVSQDSILFNDTVANNLKIGKPDASDEALLQASKIANAYEFIKELPQQFHTNIGDAGGKLSGGQKQRLSIARAVLKNPPIMILDEATSALDTESEKLVQDALEKMMKNRTSVVIAHRLSTIQNADHIVVMQKGEIVEQGTHSELLKKEGTYKKLIAMQSFE